MERERIKPDYRDIIPFIADLESGFFQIPTFQRKFEWEKENIKKLWDSIFRFYPIGSFLIWKTNDSLERHREIGGHTFREGNGNFQYILDGQQRATSLLLSLRGGKIKGEECFDPTLYIDLTYEENEEDEHGYRSFFLFWDDIDDRGGKYTINVPKKKKYEEGLIVKLKDIQKHSDEIQEHLYKVGRGDFKSVEQRNLIKVRRIFDSYRLSLIWFEGIEVREVCDIFDRINREGKPLDIVDIVVAKTYRKSTNGDKGFYLRDYFDELRQHFAGSQFFKLSDFVTLQSIASITMQDPESKVRNITNAYLPKLSANEIEENWINIKKAIIETVRFLRDTLHLVGPNMIPYGYMYHVLVNYFYKNKKPNYKVPKEWFWYVSFNPNGLGNTTQLKREIARILRARNGEPLEFEPLMIDRNILRSESYYVRSALSRAILAFMAYQRPCDFLNKDRDVLQSVYLTLGDNPNLHHFFPNNHLNNHPDQRKFKNDNDCLMNIVYLNKLENIRISDTNPLEYLNDPEFVDQEQKAEIMQKHLIPLEIIDWTKDSGLTWGNFDIFIEKRIDLISKKLKEALPNVDVKIYDNVASQQ